VKYPCGSLLWSGQAQHFDLREKLTVKLWTGATLENGAGGMAWYGAGMRILFQHVTRWRYEYVSDKVFLSRFKAPVVKLANLPPICKFNSIPGRVG
jgi:hypothetical protein